MVNSTICSVYSNTAVFHPRQTTFSWATMLIEENRAWRWVSCRISVRCYKREEIFFLKIKHALVRSVFGELPTSYLKKKMFFVRKNSVCKVLIFRFRPFACCWRTKWSIRRTSFCFVVITSVPVSIASTDSTTNAREGKFLFVNLKKPDQSFLEEWMQNINTMIVVLLKINYPKSSNKRAYPFIFQPQSSYLDPPYVCL